jgi:hypothetical protein
MDGDNSTHKAKNKGSLAEPVRTGPIWGTHLLEARP